MRDKGIGKAKDYLKIPSLEDGRMLISKAKMGSFERKTLMVEEEKGKVKLSFVRIVFEISF